MTDTPTRADLIERLIPILKRNGWGNVHEYARHIPWMLEREGLVIVEATAMTADAERIAALEGALRSAIQFLDTAPLESGTCCCGDPVDAHTYGSGHSPVDDLAYHSHNLTEELRAALKGTDHE